MSVKEMKRSEAKGPAREMTARERVAALPDFVMPPFTARMDSKKAFTVRMSAELRAKLKTFAFRKDLKLNDVVLLACENFVSTLPDEQKMMACFPLSDSTAEEIQLLKSARALLRSRTHKQALEILRMLLRRWPEVTEMPE